MSVSKQTLSKASESLPPHVWFAVSAIFHYLGPSFAVLLFPAVGVLGVAWLRIASAAAIFAPWTAPWLSFKRADKHTRALIVGLGLCLAAMNTTFYLALARLPMSLVAAMEFVGTIAIAMYGLRTPRNFFALALALLGVIILIDIKWSTDALGIMWATMNAMLFTVYIVLGHRAAESGATAGTGLLGSAMMIALLFVMPLGLGEAIKAFGSVELLVAGIGVGVCSSVIPYVCDQLAMSRLPRASFALLLTLLPATATIIAAVVLAQIPTATDLLGVALVMLGIAIHKQQAAGAIATVVSSDLLIDNGKKGEL